MTPSTNRRHLLKLASAAASTLWLPRSAWSQARFSGNPFALGVASGSPTHDSLVLWTRLVQTTNTRSVMRAPSASKVKGRHTP